MAKSKKNINRTIKYTICAFVLYYIILILCYSTVTVVKWGYYGFEFNNLLTIRNILFIVPAFIPIFVLYDYEVPSDLAALILWLTLLCGCTIVLPHLENSVPLKTLCFVYLMSTCIIFMTIIPRWVYGKFSKPSQIKIVKIENFPVSISILFFFIGGLICLEMLGQIGYKIDLSLDTHYDRRLEARNFVEAGTMTAYAFSILSDVLIPSFALLSSAKRSQIMFAFTLLMSLCVFAYSGLKNVILLAVVTYIIYKVLKRNKKQYFIIIIISLTILTGVSIVEFKITEQDNIHNYLVRREIFVPSLLSGFYLEYFNEGNFQNFAISLKRFGYEFNDLAPGYLVGYFFFGSVEWNANTNLFASGYAEMGFLGAFVAFIGATAIMSLVNYFSLYTDEKVCCMVCVWSALKWINGSFQGSLLSDGVFFLLLGLFLLKFITYDYNLAKSRYYSHS